MFEFGSSSDGLPPTAILGALSKFGAELDLWSRRQQVYRFPLVYSTGGNPMRAKLVIVLTAWVLMFLPSATSAQSATAGTIAGVVRDATGAVLPGVTVEAASPAL